MRSLSLWLLLIPSVAFADVTTPSTDEDACFDLDEGDACETEDGEDGTCDADGVCMADADDADSGCVTAGAGAGGAATLIALGLLAARRRKD